jgi:hypothetical protein
MVDDDENVKRSGASTANSGIFYEEFLYISSLYNGYIPLNSMTKDDFYSNYKHQGLGDVTVCTPRIKTNDSSITLNIETKRAKKGNIAIQGGCIT